MRQILVDFGDMQVGGTTALCPPKVELDDGGLYQASKLQKSIHRFWDKSWEHIFEVAGNDEVIGVLNGEPVDGDHHNTHQLWSRRRNEQKNAALTVLAKPMERIQRLYCVRGTQAHSGDFSVEDDIAKELGAYKLRSHYKIELTIQGNSFLFTHKGPSPGTRAWTWGNAIRYELKDQNIRAMKRGTNLPDYFIWGHYHQKAYESIVVENGGKEKTIHGYIVPGWQASTAYISSLIKGEDVMYIGMMYFIIEDGNVSHHWIVDRRDVTERVKI